MNEWMNERMNECIKEWMNDELNKSVMKWKYARTTEIYIFKIETVEWNYEIMKLWNNEIMKLCDYLTM